MRLQTYSHKKARIEIIPMIDTIFFLLVFFMIASISMTRMPVKSLEMPVSATAAENPSLKVIVTVTKDGRTFIDDKETQAAQIPSILQPKIDGNPSLAVIINCDKNQPVSTFSSIYDLVKQANPAHVLVATTPNTSWVIGQ